MFGFFFKKKPPAKKKKSEAAKPSDKAAAKGAAAKAAPADPKVAVAPKPAAKPEPPVSASDSLERAKAKLAKKAVPGSREALIEQALAVHKQQAKKLDNLPEDTRMRLRAMALKAFVLPGDNKTKSKLN